MASPLGEAVTAARPSFTAAYYATPLALDGNGNPHGAAMASVGSRRKTASASQHSSRILPVQVFGVFDSRQFRLAPGADDESGAEGNRTLDLLNAIQALSHLSYGPTPAGD